MRNDNYDQIINGKVIKTGASGTARVLIASYMNQTLKIEEYSLGGTESAISQVVDITCLAANNLSGGEYFMIHSTTQSYYVWFKKDGEGNNPFVKNATSVPVSVLTDETATEVGAKVEAAIDALADFGASATTGVVTVTNTDGGPSKNPTDGHIPTYFTLEVDTEGERKYLFDGSLGTNVVGVLDISVADDGSAEMIILEKFQFKVRDQLKDGDEIDIIPTYKQTAAGWLFPDPT